MSNETAFAPHRPDLVCSVVLLCAALIIGIAVPSSHASPGVGGQDEEAVARNERGKELLAAGDREAAIAAFDRAIEIDAEFWEPWYQRGRALALLGRYEEAAESLLQATALNPGHANAHMLTAHAAMYAEDYELAWEQGIRAYLAGEDPQTIFGGLSTRAELPADFDERIAAWRVFVAGIDTADLLASAQAPTDTRGGATGVQEELVEIQPDLLALQRHVANALSDSRGFGLVSDLGLAQYYLTIAPDEIEATPRPSMNGYLRLFSVESEDPVYFRRVEFRDLSSAGQVRATLNNLIQQLESWRLEELQKQD